MRLTNPKPLRLSTLRVKEDDLLLCQHETAIYEGVWNDLTTNLLTSVFVGIQRTVSQRNHFIEDHAQREHIDAGVV